MPHFEMTISLINTSDKVIEAITVLMHQDGDENGIDDTKAIAAQTTRLQELSDSFQALIVCGKLLISTLFAWLPNEAD